MWPVLAIGGAIFVGAIALLSSESEAAEREWHARKEDLSNEISSQREKLRRYKAQAELRVQYHYLVNEHYKSVQLANKAYQALQNSQIILDNCRQGIQLLKNRRTELKSELDGATKVRRTQIFEEMALLKTNIDQFYENMTQYVADKTVFLEEVRNLNSETTKLKQMIRDTAGQQGRDWYNRLEARKSARHSLARR